MLGTLVAPFVFGSVFLLVLAVSRSLSKAYRQYEERYLAKSVKQFGDLFLFIDSKQMLILNLASMSMLGLVGYAALNPAFAVALTIFGCFLPAIFVRRYRIRRIRKFNAQLVDALQAMSNAFQAGRTFPQAAEHVAQEARPPLSQEFGLLVKEIKLGVPVDEALVNMAGRVGSEDLELVVVSTNISRQVGGNMAEMFETVAATIRERFRLEGRISALTAQGKLQGWIVGAMPLLLGVVIWRIRPDLMEPMLNHLFGYVLVSVIAMMEIFGMLIIRRIVNIDI